MPQFYSALHIESFLGFGAKDVAIEHSLNGENWTALDGVGPLAQAPGVPGYPHNNTIDFGGVIAQHVRLTINSVQGFVTQASLSEVRFFHVPTHAWKPQPALDATDVDPMTLLNWRPGREADTHVIHLGTDATHLALVDNATDSRFDPASLDLLLGQTYHWRVDEVNEVMDPSTWMGDVWRFTTTDAINVDNMERFRDKEYREIWDTWKDGFNDPANGGLVGNGTTGTPETNIVHSPGQSLPFHFLNSGTSISEATRTFDLSQDWTRSGIQTLVLFFKRSADTTGGDGCLSVAPSHPASSNSRALSCDPCRGPWLSRESSA